jgi:isoquinoline 1-oxidoreductase beta subunit
MTNSRKPSKLKTITRRSFLVGSAAIAGGVVFGYYKYQQAHLNPLTAGANDSDKQKTVLTPYICIDQQGITIIAPRAEMGQGVHTTLAALVAEELDVAWQDIKVIHGPASSAYFNGAVLEDSVPFASTDNGFLANSVRDFVHLPAKFLGMQITGGSSSVIDAYNKMRVAGAAARDVLLSCAAEQTGDKKSQLSTALGYVIRANGEKISYIALAHQAQNFEPPAAPKLKDKSQWQLLGKSLPRVDMVEKCSARAQYALDIRLPDMIYASVKMNPNLGAKMISFDATKAQKMKGVEQIIEIEGKGVGVIASNTWYAMQALNAIEFSWGKAAYPSDNQGMFEAVAAAFIPDLLDSEFKHDGDVTTSLEQSEEQSLGQIVTGQYRVPYLAHAAMEPMNATALLRDGKLDIWAGSQIPTQVIKEAQSITGLSAENINLHTTYLGGSFGRKLEMDFIRHAVIVAKALAGTPVKVTWSREEDITHDNYRPLAMAKFKGVVKDGEIKTFDLQLACPSIIESQMGRIGLNVPGPDMTIVQGAWEQPYKIENYRVRGYRVPTLLPVSSWRSVGASQNGFFHESAIDELAFSAGVDALAMRLKLIDHKASRGVLQAVAKMSNWGAALPKGQGLGLAFIISFGVPCAQVILVEDTSKGIKIIKAYAAVDVGTALDPRNIEAQVISGLNFGLAAAMMSEITVKDGQVQQSNFHDYQGLRINQAPEIEVKILQDNDKIRGIGEPATPPAAPALANAIFAATGKRIRELPLNKSIRFV